MLLTIIKPRLVVPTTDTPQRFCCMILQVTLNVFMFVALFHISSSIFNVIKEDVKNQIEIRIMEHEQHVLTCFNNYHLNNCSTIILPATQELCQTWHTCMKKTLVVLTSKQVATLCARTLNNFFDELSQKTLTCCVGISLLLIMFKKSLGRSSNN